MPLSHEEHEELLSKLNDPELSAEDRTETLTSIRNNYTTFQEEHESVTQKNEKLQTSNDDLLKANAKLFNETGYQFHKDPTKNDPPEPEVGETISIEDFEKTLG